MNAAIARTLLASALALVAVALPALADNHDADDPNIKIGKTGQSLVAGDEVSSEEQQQQVLVKVSIKGSGACSGTLLNSEWVISAVHCFKGANAKDITFEADWPKNQTRTGIELHRFEKDVAIIRVDKPFDDVDPFFNLPVYTGTLSVGRALKIYGRGIHEFAKMVDGVAVESQFDGKFRSGDFTISRIDEDDFWYGPGRNGASVAGGDSGGPAFINAGGRSTLAGISSDCNTRDLKGTTRDKSDPWKWVSEMDECGHAPLATMWPDILKRIGTPTCRRYAWRAVGSVEYAKQQNCNPATISGPRWDPDFDHHLDFCMGGASAAVMKTEADERFRISQECRITAGLPKGDAKLQITQSSTGVLLTGTGYAVNARVIIRATDASGSQSSITRHIADGNGQLFASIEFSEVCSVAGPITFTAEDQDANNTQLGTYGASPPVAATCPPPAPAGAGDGGSPIAADAQAFNGTWSMRMSNGVGYQLTLEVDRNNVNGTFRSPGRRQLDGTVAGRLNHRNKNGRFEYTFSQPGTGLTSFGVMTVHEDGTLKGTLDEASDGKSYTWTGTRAGAGAVEEDPGEAPPPEDGIAADEGAGEPAPPPEDDIDIGGADPGAGGDFAGTWDMRNGSGTQFMLTMKVSGKRVSGTFFTPGRPKNKGSLRGRIKDNGDLVYDFEQPGIRVRGKGVMTIDGDTVEGTFTVGSKRLTWGGNRTNAAAAGDDFGAAGDGGQAGGEDLGGAGDEADGGAGGGGLARVVQSVDVYDAPGGNGTKTGFLKTATKVKVIGCENDWCEVQGKKVPGGSGYVYNGDDYRSLRF